MLITGKKPGNDGICQNPAMRIRIDSTWLPAAISTAADAIALIFPGTGIALLVLAALILLAGVRVED